MTGSSEDAAIERLLGQSRKILGIRQELRRGRSLRFRFLLVWWLSGIFVPALVLLNIIAWGHLNLTRTNIACIPVALVLVALSFGTGSMASPGYGPNEYTGQMRGEPWRKEDLASLELDLETELERARLQAARLHLSESTRRHIYREEVPRSVEHYRQGQRYYRRVHNALQSIVIVGSLASSTIAGLAEVKGMQKWLLVGVTFSVGLASGFTGYFKFRERGFYLQQTADSVDEEFQSLHLGVGRYKNIDSEEEALSEFAERVEAIKSEQRKREQQLDQPAQNNGQQ